MKRFVPFLFVLSISSVALAQEVPIVPTPPRPSRNEELEEEEAWEAEEAAEEGEPIDEGFDLPPIPDEPPQFRLRAGAGVGLPTAGATTPAFRLTQDFEIQLRDIAPFYFGVGGAEVFTAESGIIGQAGLNAGLAAWIARDPLYRLQGAIHVHLGAAFGGGYANFDIGGEVDIRMLVANDVLELHVRGGFFTFVTTPYINISAGLGVAF